MYKVSLLKNYETLLDFFLLANRLLKLKFTLPSSAITLMHCNTHHCFPI